MNAKTCQKLRIGLTVASAIALVPIIPVAAIFGFIPAVIEAGIATLLFCGAIYFKKRQEELENPPEDRPDFFNPKQ